jgi:HEAT repeat protein
MALHALGCDACKLRPLPRDCDVLALIIDHALNDPNITVRRHAASELGQHGHDPRAVEALTLLADHDHDAAILRSVQRALRRHGRTA